MTLIKWKPKRNSLTSDFFNQPFFSPSLLPQWDELFDRSWQSWIPAVDVSEDKNQITVKADLPGFKKEDIQLHVNGSILTIRGERKSETDNKEKNYHRIERSFGVFERSFDVGTIIDQSKVKANYRDGVLEIDIPKSIDEQNKTIRIE